VHGLLPELPGRPAPPRYPRHARRELVHRVLASPDAPGAGRGARSPRMGCLSGLRVVFGDPRGGVRHARMQARKTLRRCRQMDADARGSDMDHRAASARQVRSDDVCRERPCRTQFHPRASAYICCASAWSPSCFAAGGTGRQGAPRSSMTRGPGAASLTLHAVLPAVSDARRAPVGTWTAPRPRELVHGVLAASPDEPAAVP
jgi:hypothetical protein